LEIVARPRPVLFAISFIVAAILHGLSALLFQQETQLIPSPLFHPVFILSSWFSLSHSFIDQKKHSN